MFFNSHFHAKNLKNQQTQFVKINRNRKDPMINSLGHSKITSNNFSRRNSLNTIVTSVSSVNSLKSLPKTINSRTPNTSKTSRENRKLHSQQSWSMSQHLKNNQNEVGNDYEFNKKINNYEFTERRCHYERIVEEMQQEPQRSWSSEQVLNSRISTFATNQNDYQYDLLKVPTKLCDEISKDFLGLSEFRMQNSKDCFNERRQQKLPTESPDKTSKIFNKFTETYSSEMNGCELKDSKKTSKCLPSLSVAKSLSPTPYAVLQKMLRGELVNDFLHKVIFTPTVNKSTALSYQQMY